MHTEPNTTVKGSYYQSACTLIFLLHVSFMCFLLRFYHFLQVRGYTSLRAITPRGSTKGWPSAGLVLGPGWQLSEQAPRSSSIPSAPPPQPFSAAPLPMAEAPLACCSTSLCTSSCTPITRRESSSMLRCCSKSGRTTGRLRSTSKVS